MRKFLSRILYNFIIGFIVFLGITVFVTGIAGLLLGKVIGFVFIILSIVIFSVFSVLIDSKYKADTLKELIEKIKENK